MAQFDLPAPTNGHRLRILYAAPGTPVPGTHGGSVHALELCRALSRRGHEVHLAAPVTGPASARAQGSDTDLDGIFLHPLRRWLPARLLEWTAALPVRRLAAKLHPDVLVERFYTFGGGALWAAQSLRIPAVLEINSPARPYPGSWRDRLDQLTLLRPIDRWRRCQLRWARGLYATSRHLLPPEVQEQACVVVNGVDIERFRPSLVPASDRPLHCVYVSSFRRWHGAEDLVAAASICAQQGVPLQISCIGRGPRWPAARRAAAAASLGGTIEFVGEVSHQTVPSYLAGADVGLAPFTPSAHRALELGWFWSPIKIFEYLAAGLGVVTADLEELRELLPGGVARFYPAGEPAALAESLAVLAADRAAVGRMGVAARSLAESRYTWDQQAVSVERVLERVLRGCRPCSP
ncbi:MAG: glycosyltransferase family 4 protein [Acidobacteriota bacterium]